MAIKTNFQLTVEMNVAFGNSQGIPAALNFDRIRKQALNIADEFGELMKALGADDLKIKAGVELLKACCAPVTANGVDIEGVRDALCDINVFSYGTHHLLGYDADADFKAVIDGVMTRFIKDEADKQATIALHASKGVTDVYFEGEFPKMVMKSASDQPDAPKGKFPKSASFSLPVFPAASQAGV